MSARLLQGSVNELPVLLRGQADPINDAIQHCTGKRILLYLTVIFIGAGCFGATVGYWRDPLQVLYTAIKFPAILLLTALGNALLNGMLAPLLGLNITFRQSLVAILLSFTIAAAILGSLSPILLFLVCNTPSFAKSGPAYNLLLLTQTVAIAFAGIAANVRLFQLLQRLGGSKWVAQKIVFAWLAVNLLLGAQLSWNLRPFVGSPGLQVQFLRPNAFQGNFFEAIYYNTRQIFISHPTQTKP
jgi:hypothetical protein